MLISWLVLALGLAMSLAAMPVRVGFLLSSGQPAAFGITFGPLRRRYSVRVTATQSGHALLIESGRSQRVLPVSALRNRSKQPGLPFSKIIVYIIRHTRADRLDCRLALSTGSAARDCVAIGLLRALADALAHVEPSLNLTARFDCRFGQQSEGHALGIFSCRAGHIMLAALMIGREVLIRRLKSWKSTPSKAS